MEEKWLEFAELFGDAFLELIEGEHTVTITLAKNKLERVKNLLEKHLQEDIENEKKRQMIVNDKINLMSVEEKAKLFSGWTVAGACNDFGIKHERKCDGDCETCLKEWLLLEVNKKDSTF